MDLSEILCLWLFQQIHYFFLLLCCRQEVDGTYILELHKDEKKGDAKATIVMDFCTEVVRVSKAFEVCVTV